VRAWQTVRASTEGIQRVSCVELDLASGPALGAARLEYVPLRPRDRVRQMCRLGELMSQFGRQAPRQRAVLVVSRRGPEETFAERYPRLPRPACHGATVVSADVGEIAVLDDALRLGQIEIRSKRPHVAPSVGSTRSGALRTILDRIWNEERIAYCPAGKDDFRAPDGKPEVVDLLVPLSARGGLLSDGVGKPQPECAFNGGYYLWFDEEVANPYSFCLEPVGLVLHDGEVLSPPLYRRSAVIVSTAAYARTSDEARYSLQGPKITVRELALDNVSIAIGERLAIRGQECRLLPARLRHQAGVEVHTAATNPPAVRPHQVALYTRMFGRNPGSGQASVCTPAANDRVECVIVGREIASIKEGGESFIPMNGFILSLPGRLLEPLKDALDQQGHVVEYALDAGADAVRPESAVQVGPRLVRRHERLDVLARVAAGVEEFAPCGHDGAAHGAPPLFLTPERQLDGRIARMGLGLCTDARCYVALIEGCEPRTSFVESDSVGATAREIADVLVELGCSDVVELDGGGSAGLFVGGRAIAKGADRNDIPFIAAERPVPGAWFFWSS
jgi:hypothetical protein